MPRALLVTAVDATHETLAAALDLAAHGLTVEPADHAASGATLDDNASRAIVRAPEGSSITTTGVEIVRATLRAAGVEASVEPHDEG